MVHLFSIECFGVIGIFASLKKHKQIFLFSLVFVLLNIYLISCFSSLISYGYRAFVQSYAVLLLPLAVVIEFVLNRRKWLVVLFFIAIAGLTYLNVIQARQLELEILDKSRMTKAAFFAILGKWDPPKPESLMRVNRTGFGIDTLRAPNFTISGLSWIMILRIRIPAIEVK